MEDKIKYSILMSVYIKENPDYLRQSIESMLNQTILSNDFVIVCDGLLTPELDNIIEEYSTRYPLFFRILRLEKNQGLGNALNAGLEICKNELVARMDSDDISLSYRCELQLKKFTEDPSLALCSGNIIEFKEQIKDINRVKKVPLEYEEILRYARKRNPMNHMAVMFKKSAVKEVGGYIEISLTEDYYLWIRMLQKGYKAINIKQILVYARIGNGMYERRGGLSYARSAIDFQTKMLDLKFITYPEFIINCIIRCITSMVPISVRRLIYEKKLRSNL